MTTAIAPARSRMLIPLALLAVALGWAYWTTFVDLIHAWNSNQDYSHGFLVPVFAGFLLWSRRDKLDLTAARPNVLGVALLLFGLALKLGGTWGHYVSLDSISLLPCVAGVVVLLGGWAAWRWAWPAVLFLAFMIPLPYFAAVAMSGNLQSFATTSSTFVMQALGLPALAEGNTILLNDQTIGIVEACSGLRMLMVFFALSTAMVLVVQRHWIDKLVILLSAVPIALACNILRIVGTGLLYELGFSDAVNHFFHDFAGWLMMPVGLGMMWLELGLLNKLFIDGPKPIPSTRATATLRRTMQQQQPRAVPAAARPRRATARTATPKTTEQPSNPI